MHAHTFLGLQVTIVAESFGGCLALRLAVSAPQLIARLILVNPATSFARSYARIPSLIAATNLLSIFPEQLYQVRHYWNPRHWTASHSCLRSSEDGET